MAYYVPMDKMEQYLNLEIEDNDLFPNEAPVGTSFYDLAPEGDTCCIVKKDHLIKMLSAFLNDAFNDNRVKEYVETLIALDLYVFDEETNQIHDLIANVVFTLDELKDVNGEITKEDAQKLLDKLKEV